MSIWRCGAIRVYVVKVDEPLNEETFGYLLEFIDNEKKERVLKQKIKQNADNMLIGEILKKSVIKKTFDIDFENQRVSLSEYKKPYFPDYPEAHFNISHSGEYVALAVSDKPVGVDIQKIKEYNYDVAKRVCNEKELRHLEENSDKANEFIKLWTQKEAVLKMKGVGIANGDIKNCIKNHNVMSERIEDYWLSVCEK